MNHFVNSNYYVLKVWFKLFERKTLIKYQNAKMQISSQIYLISNMDTYKVFS
jgi:hypothetical protein